MGGLNLVRTDRKRLDPIPPNGSLTRRTIANSHWLSWIGHLAYEEDGAIRAHIRRHEVDSIARNEPEAFFVTVERISPIEGRSFSLHV